MNTMMKKYKHAQNLLGITLVLTAVGWLTGCASLRPLASEPPKPSITLSSPVVIKGFLGMETILPAGDYTPTLEDKKGYYYQAPAKIIRNDTSSWQLDGGLFVERGSTAPTHYYVVSRNHITDLTRLGTDTTLPIEP